MDCYFHLHLDGRHHFHNQVPPITTIIVIIIIIIVYNVLMLTKLNKMTERYSKTINNC